MSQRPPSIGPATTDIGPATTDTVSTRRRGKKNLTLWVGLVMTSVFIGLAVMSMFWVPMDPNGVAPGNRLLPVGSPDHPMGTDHLGRDVLSSIMVGARTSMLIAAGAALLGMVIGGAAGLIAAASRSVVDETIMRLADILLSVPGVVFALVLAATIGAGASSTVIALTVFFVPTFARVVRSAALRVLTEDFITAARLYGRRNPFILGRHVVPNVGPLLIVQFTLYFAIGILTEAALSYIGVGVGRPMVSWGMMLKEAQDMVGVSSPLALWPGMAIVFAVLGLNLFGDGLRDKLDPRLSRR